MSLVFQSMGHPPFVKSIQRVGVQRPLFTQAMKRGGWGRFSQIGRTFFAKKGGHRGWGRFSRFGRTFFAQKSFRAQVDLRSKVALQETFRACAGRAGTVPSLPVEVFSCGRNL